jgi:hypothetical protein
LSRALGSQKICPILAHSTGLLGRRERSCWRRWWPRNEPMAGRASPQWRGLGWWERRA